MHYIQEYKLQDAQSNLRAFSWLNFLLAFCILAPDFFALRLDAHAAVLLIQGGVLLGYLRWRQFQTKTVTTGIFVLILLTTVHEVSLWVSQLDGVINGGEIGGKGAPFAFLFQSPPYLYPLIRIGSLLLFFPIFRTFGFAAWDGHPDRTAPWR
ncbi:hypothetical protein CLV84_0601 [Neolewinella xylanilytica]|uniref:Uncharacterized protein n=1 Tax=Neolewinella xylanilytica TaxID=1514080 RepID=A0A2S6I833_9BACT|nr:hypothetical protein [Neolewinella xylanilytica]PPK87653.1 hypothetical protein CLV84_0601 [Neolewinella xylanilytica]